MLRSNAWHVQPEHSMGAVVKHGGRGPLSVGQAAAEAASEAGRRPAMPVVQRERLKSHDGARSTAGVLLSRRLQKELPATSIVALHAAYVPWPPHRSRLGLSARAASL